MKPSPNGALPRMVSLRPGALQRWYEEGRPKALPEGSTLQAEKRSASSLRMGRQRALSCFSQSNPQPPTTGNG